MESLICWQWLDPSHGTLIETSRRFSILICEIGLVARIRMCSGGCYVIGLQDHSGLVVVVVVACSQSVGVSQCKIFRKRQEKDEFI
jgi:hypothetical protein